MMKEKTFYKVIEVNFLSGESFVIQCADKQSALICKKSIEEKDYFKAGRHAVRIFEATVDESDCHDCDLNDITAEDISDIYWKHVHCLMDV